MADLFKLSNLAASDVAGNGPGAGTDLSTGDMRRKYNFGNRVSELSVAQDPFFRFLSKVSKKATDDPSFKFTERRGSWHKRYAYMAAYDASAGAAPSTAPDNAGVTVTQGLNYTFKMGADYSNQGNLQNRLGQTMDHVVGGTNTKPNFFLKDSIIRVPHSASGAGMPSGYTLWKINSVTDSGEYVVLNATCVKGSGASVKFNNSVGTAGPDVDNAASKTSSEETLADYKCYVVGTAFEEGSGYPETWKDQPFSTNYGQTQIWKTAMAMTNTARATVLKYDPNEWARVWKEHLISHKWDIEQSLLFGSQYSADGINYTQGAVDYITNYGNVFDLNINTKTADDFLEDLSGYMDPRYAASAPTVYFCDTQTWNWLHKLGGYFKNNLEMSPNFRADMAITGKKKIFGVDITTISTPYGDINVARNIHLDGTDIRLLGCNMKNCSWRPLVGNGVNRDTSVYVGVQTLENSGIDRRVDLILTEGGMEWSLPETHAVWKNA